jgi:chromosome segregation protein
VTAIVGSNGCGKSNVADAIRWVLGEQRPSVIRGARMDEVIFAGTAQRRPLAFAEATLLFDNQDGAVPVPQSEIEIARKVFREGGSEYSLNRVSCRLRDVQDLLRDTGLGADAYSIIELGMIDAILSDRAEERRGMFEEAAGIGRYKDRRRTALRRLEAAEGDLARLADLIAEVESKVRGLARQRRRAERHDSVQARRRDLEVALVRHDSAGWETALHAAAAREADLRTTGSGVGAERAAAEAASEGVRGESIAADDARRAAAGGVEKLRRALDERERHVLLCDERRSHAELRLAQLARERTERVDDAQRLGTEHQTARSELEVVQRELAELRSGVEQRAVASAEAREALSARRAAADDARGRETAAARAVAAVEEQVNVGEARAAGASKRAARLADRSAALASESSALDDGLAARELDAAALREHFADLEREAEELRAASAARRAEEERLAAELRIAEDESQRLAAELAAREALERGYGGFAPAVAEVMSSRERFPGVLGPLADYLPSAAEDPDAAEAFLGPLVGALVAKDRDAVRALRRWFRDDWQGGGSLLLLPLDAPGLRERSGKGWADALLEDLERVDADELLGDRRGPRVDARGDVVDARGVVRLGEGGTRQGILARRRALAELREAAVEAGGVRDRVRAGRDAAAAVRTAAEEQARTREEERSTAAAALRRLEAETEGLAARRERLAAEAEAAAVESEAARAEADEVRRQRIGLLASLEALRATLAEAADGAAAARGALGEAEEGWEAARAAEAELRVALARAEGAAERAVGRRDNAAAEMERTRLRIGVADAEAAELREAVQKLAASRARAGEEIGALFEQRDGAERRLQAAESEYARLQGRVRELEERVRVARRREAEESEERHRLQLERSELTSRLERARERVEAEWRQPWDALLDAAGEVDGKPDEWREELAALSRRLETLGPINMLASAEHAEEERRLHFLREQQEDLVRARDDLSAAVREINRTARAMFESTFESVRENFTRTFESLFPGGQCDLRLSDPDDPLETDIEIQASPRGKRTQRIHLLSGGERTLTALALLFAIYLVKPSPFCLFDEVDAPLDENNIGRFVRLLEEFKSDTQFIVITHNPRTMEAADWIYGVTMEEPGISTVVSVELRESWAADERVA